MPIGVGDMGLYVVGAGETLYKWVSEFVCLSNVTVGLTFGQLNGVDVLTNLGANLDSISFDAGHVIKGPFSKISVASGTILAYGIDYPSLATALKNSNSYGNLNIPPAPTNLPGFGSGFNLYMDIYDNQTPQVMINGPTNPDVLVPYGPIQSNGVYAINFTAGPSDPNLKSWQIRFCPSGTEQWGYSGWLNYDPYVWDPSYVYIFAMVGPSYPAYDLELRGASEKYGFGNVSDWVGPFTPA